MKQLLENWGKFINEQLEHYEMECVLKAEPDTQIYGSIFNKIRAVEGVTILKTSEKMQQDSEGNKYIQLNIKIMLPHGMSLGEFKYEFNEKMRTLTDDEGDRIISSRILGNPQLVDPD